MLPLHPRQTRFFVTASLLLLCTLVEAQSLDAAKHAAKVAIKAFAKDMAHRVEDRPRLLATLKDKRINESSGLAASWRNTGVLWTHNDSGDKAWVYAINYRGETLSRFKVPNAVNVDWEDIAVGPGVNGDPALYISDLGDNNHNRDDTTIYIAPEPSVDTAKTLQESKTAPCVAYPVRYPDGHHDCETLLVHPKTGEIVVVTKEGSGHSGIYRYPMPLRPNEKVTLEKVGAITFHNSLLRGDSLYAQAERMATGGSVRRDGLRAIVRTYTKAYEWVLTSGQSLAEGLRGTPQQFFLPLTIQGESICYRPDGKALLTTSEKLPTPLMEIPH